MTKVTDPRCNESHDFVGSYVISPACTAYPPLRRASPIPRSSAEVLAHAHIPYCSLSPGAVLCGIDVDEFCRFDARLAVRRQLDVKGVAQERSFQTPMVAIAQMRKLVDR
jgi:hypothetical protein